MWGRTGAQHPFPPFAAKRGTIFYTDEASLRVAGARTVGASCEDFLPSTDGASLFPYDHTDRREAHARWPLSTPPKGIDSSDTHASRPEGSGRQAVSVRQEESIVTLRW